MIEINLYRATKTVSCWIWALDRGLRLRPTVVGCAKAQINQLTPTAGGTAFWGKVLPAVGARWSGTVSGSHVGDDHARELLAPSTRGVGNGRAPRSAPGGPTTYWAMLASES